MSNLITERATTYFNKSGMRAEAEAAAKKAGYTSPRDIADYVNAAKKEFLEDTVGAYSTKLSGYASRVANRVTNPLSAYGLGYVGRHPYISAGVGAATLGATGAFNLASSAISAVSGLIPDSVENGISTLGGLASGAGNFGFETLGSVFSAATNGLEYIGMDPTWAKGVVGLGTFFALKSAMDMITEGTGLNKFSPLISGLGVLIAAGVIAYKIADAAGDSELTASEQNDKPALAIGMNAPAPVMP